MKKLFLILFLLIPTLAIAQSGNNPRNPAYYNRNNGLDSVGVNAPLPVTETSPNNGIAASATGSTGAVSVLLASALGKTTYLCSVQISETGSGTATAQALNTVNTLNYLLAVPGTISKDYSPCIAANAIATPISLTIAANISATLVSVTATGYQK